MRASKSLFSTSEPAYAVNRDGVIMAWNPAAESTFGFSESEAMGQHCWELLAGQDLFGNQYCCEGCPLREMAFREKSVKSNEMFFKTADNEMKKFSVCTLVLYDGPGTNCLCICAVRNAKQTKAVLPRSAPANRPPISGAAR